MPAAEREAELAERRDVGADALLGEDPHQRDVRERLRPVADERVRSGLAVGARPGAERRLVVDEERAAVLAHEVGGGEPADRELAAVDPRRVGEELEHAAILPVDERPIRRSSGTDTCTLSAVA